MKKLKKVVVICTMISMLLSNVQTVDAAHKHSDSCYQNIYHKHSDGCYQNIYHKHSDSCYQNIYHKHSDGCYQKTYHKHSGNSNEKGGCYTKEKYCGGTLEKKKIGAATCGQTTQLADYGEFYDHSTDAGGDVPSGRFGYRARSCPTHGIVEKNSYTGFTTTGVCPKKLGSDKIAYVCPTCGSTYDAEGTCTKVIGYGTGCGKNEGAVESSTLVCGKNESTVEGTNTICGKDESTVEGTNTICGKDEKTVVDRKLVCGLEESDDPEPKPEPKPEPEPEPEPVPTVEEPKDGVSLDININLTKNDKEEIVEPEPEPEKSSFDIGAILPFLLIPAAAAVVVIIPLVFLNGNKGIVANKATKEKLCSVKFKNNGGTYEVFIPDAVIPDEDSEDDIVLIPSQSLIKKKSGSALLIKTYAGVSETEIASEIDIII